MFKYVQTCLNHNSNIFFIKTVIIFLKICSNLLLENIIGGGGGAGEGAGIEIEMEGDQDQVSS